MKNFKLCIASLAVFAMFFTSCSKDETGVQDSEKATLTLGAIVNDMVTDRAATKQALGDIPACSDDTPAFVGIVVTQGGNDVVGTADEPYMVNLAPGQLFTVEDPALELDPGNYTLDHFSVYNEDGDLIWIAPRVDADLAGFVDAPLPLSIDLGAGVKKYVDVSVLCFDDRDVNQYGYLFFELDAVQAIEFCFFANYCDDDGRHFTANYSVDVWLGTSSAGTQLYNDYMPTTGVNDDGDYFASPVCLALPSNDNADEDYLYYEVTLLDWEANYGNVEPMVISGTLSRNDIEANFGPGLEVEYEHLGFNCDGNGNGNGGVTPPPPPPTSDCIPAPAGDCDTLIFEQTVDVVGFPIDTNPFYAIFVDGEEVGTITFDLEESDDADDVLTASVDLFEDFLATDAEITLPEFVDADAICVQGIDENDFNVVYIADDINYPVEVEFAANICGFDD